MTTALLITYASESVLPVEIAIGVNVALQCADNVHVLVFGNDAVAKQMACIRGVNRVFVANDPVFAHALAEPCAAEIATLGERYDAMLMASNATGKNILPRVSGLLKRPMLSDVIATNKGTFVRPIYAGNALETVSISGQYLFTFRPTSFEAVTETQPACAIESRDTVTTNKHSEWVSVTSHPKARPELTNAKYVVAGGRGLKSKEQFQLIEQLADCLGAAVGASRAAVDAGFVPNDCQVGQTGKIVAPELYIAIGISGAIQHLAGMKSSKVIVAINQDADAPIFQIADYGWVADLFEAVPALEKALKNARDQS